MEGGIDAIATLDTIAVLLVKVALLLALSLITNRLLRAASASTKYFLLSSTVVVAAISPLLFHIVPDSRLPVPIIIEARQLTEPVPQATASEPAAGIPQEVPISGRAADAGPITSVSGKVERAVLCLWLLGTCVAIGRVLLGLAGCIIHCRGSSGVVPDYVVGIVAEAARTMDVRGSPEVIISPRSAVPYVCGIIRPVLVLPEAAMRWPKGRLRYVVLHELAHIKRHDHITWPLINLAASWLWFLPLIWMVLSQSKREKERACDDYVLSRENREDYAHHLLQVCASMQTAARPISVSFLITRNSELKERVTYMFRNGIDREPTSRIKKILLIGLVLALTVPLLSVTGLSGQSPSREVTLDEREAAIAALHVLYNELSNGSDFQATKQKCLTSDYFSDPSLTLENLDEAVWRPTFDNTLNLIETAGIGVAREVRCRVASVIRDADELVVTQRVDVMADRFEGVIESYDDDGSVVRTGYPAHPSEKTVTNCFLVKDLEQKVRLRMEDGVWKISQFDDGLALMQMDTDNPYGPIFLVWIDDINGQTTPYGSGVFKVFPRDVIPDARNTQFVLETK
jgi:beta-lactamase regulating signal transducer with metallopeptidase domain